MCIKKLCFLKVYNTLPIINITEKYPYQAGKNTKFISTSYLVDQIHFQK